MGEYQKGEYIQQHYSRQIRTLRLLQKNEKFIIKNMVRTSKPKNQEFHNHNEPQPKRVADFSNNFICFSLSLKLVHKVFFEFLCAIHSDYSYVPKVRLNLNGC